MTWDCAVTLCSSSAFCDTCRSVARFKAWIEFFNAAWLASSETTSAFDASPINRP